MSALTGMIQSVLKSFKTVFRIRNGKAA